jgi:hypothetical protein
MENGVEGSPTNRIKGLLGLETEFLSGVHLKGRVHQIYLLKILVGV